MAIHLNASDRKFMNQFWTMIALLALGEAICVVIGAIVWASLPKTGNEIQVQQAGQRITPVSAVYAGNAGQAALAAAAKPAAAPAAAYGGTLDGKTIFNDLCTTCHTNPATGAPDIHDKAAWAPRVAEGIPTLVKHAIDGYKGPHGNGPVMPPKGGNPALTDAQVKATVEWIVSQVK